MRLPVVLKKWCTILIPGLLFAFWPHLAAAVAVDARAQELFRILDQGGALDEFLERNNWPHDDGLVSYLEWELLFHPRYKATTERLQAFLQRWPEHAQADRVQALLESRLTKEGENEETLAFYDRFKPKTVEAKQRYLRLLGERKRLADGLPIWKALYLDGVAFPEDLERLCKPLEEQLTLAEKEVRLRKLLHSGPQEAYDRIFAQLPTARQNYFRTVDAALHGLPAFESHLAQLPANEADNEEIWDAQAKYLRRTLPRKQFIRFILEKKSSKLTPKTRYLYRYQLAKELINEREVVMALSLLRANIVEAGGKAPDSLWLGAWHSLQQGNRQQALSWFGKLAMESTSSAQRAQGGYWAARLSANKTEKNKWLSIAARYPESFYGLLAQEQLAGRLSLLPADPLQCPSRWGAELEAKLATPRQLQALGRSHHNGAEIRKLASRLHLSQNDQICLAKELGAADLAVQLAASVRKEGQVIFSALYPQPDWQPLRGWELEPALVWSTTRQESLFQRHSESATKAYGLMQLMPATAVEESNRMGLPTATRHLLQWPAYNLAVGQSYLARMLKLFDGDLLLAVAAYNAGPGRALSWRASREKEDPILFIEKIPFSETREYVKRVLHGWAIYRLQAYSQVSLENVLREKKPGTSQFLSPSPATK
ncbi:lytic transglycosylase domain-containing protein [Candidatus Magnetaquicoccus inordinatus]|uniref:lytic transglycosylase domain-containing protein n=1 Tax=Candidatus Magnetaquicoccus inordinatus TaxID=2496818 RepID=UPI00102BDD6E|nr:lytic transglycosylase domain-containing protein [Candidatus Magnetaquicoccus inordinatus]